MRTRFDQVLDAVGQCIQTGHQRLHLLGRVIGDHPVVDLLAAGRELTGNREQVVLVPQRLQAPGDSRPFRPIGGKPRQQKLGMAKVASQQAQKHLLGARGCGNVRGGEGECDG